MVPKYHVLAGALAASAFVVGAPAVYAEGAIEEIVVTGSYIRRAPEDAPSPIQVLGREELEAKGLPQLADMIATLPSVVGSENVTSQDQSVGGAGAANINIRNLGLASTLVLLDGKRLNTGTSTSNQGEQFVDINRLPFIMIENVEILKDGASALYGSDAVAGVANFKLRNRFEGFEIQGMYQDSFKKRDLSFNDTGLPEIYRDPINSRSKDKHSDTDIGAIWGFGNDTTHFVIGANYFEREALETLDRRFAVRNVIDPFAGGSPSPFNLPQDQFDAMSGSFVYDSSCVALGHYRTVNGGYCSTKNDLLSRDMYSEEQRLQVLATWTHDISDRVEAYGHFGMSENEVRLNQSPSLPITSQVTYGADNPGLRYEVNRGIEHALATGTAPNGDDIANRLGFPGYPFPVLPFAGQFDPLTADADTVLAYLDAVGGVTFNGVVRNSLANLQNAMGVPADVNGDGVVDPGEIFRDRSHSTIDRETRIFMAGLRGDLNDDWQFDVSYNFSSETSQTVFYDTVTERLERGLSGFLGPNCTGDEPGNIANGCYWFNPFGSSLLEPDTEYTDAYGNVHTLGNDAAYVAGMIGQGVVDIKSELTVIDTVLSTNDFFGLTLPGGNVGFAVGAQYRKEARRSGGNELATNPTFPFAFTGPTIPFSASQEIFAVFFEFALPLTDRLEAQIAVRYEDYGGDTGDTIDPKLALRWQALDNVTVRGSVGTSFRGPSISQKYGRGTGLQYVAGPSRAAVDANLGTDFDTTGLFGAVFARQPTYGNPDLKPEESLNFNIGVIWDATDDLTLSLDYFNYKYEDIIITEDFRGLANDCQIGWAAAGQPVVSVDGVFTDEYLAIEPCNFRNLDGNAATPDIELANFTGSPLNIQRTYANGSELKASGLDLLSRYTLGTDYGIFGASLALSWFLEYEIDRAVTPFDTRVNPGETVDLVGRSENVLVGRPLPEYKGTLLLDWSWNQHYASLMTNYVSHIVEPDAFTLPGGAGFADQRVRSHTTVDASYTYNFTEVDLSLTAGALNLFDRDPPVASGFNGYESTIHDPRGRMWYMRARFGF